MTFDPRERLSETDAAFPGFLNFYSRLLGYYFAACPREHPEVASRMVEALERLGAEGETALSEFAREGIFSGEPFSSRRQVELFWRSPLMELFEVAIGYTPSPETDLSKHMPQPVTGPMELVCRRQTVAQRVVDGELARGELPYWQACLSNCAPELYLLPYLPRRETLVGVDVGAGWGRGTLLLPELSRFKVTAFDVSEEQLSIMRALARNLGWGGLQTRATAVLSLPDDSADFGVSMAFLDLLEKEQLLDTLRELLRILRPYGLLHIEAPTRSTDGITVVTQFSTEQLFDMFHSVEAGGKVFQLLEYDPRVPDLFTFAVLDKDLLPPGPRTGRAAHRRRPQAKRLLRDFVAGDSKRLG